MKRTETLRLGVGGEAWAWSEEVVLFRPGTVEPDCLELRVNLQCQLIPIQTFCVHIFACSTQSTLCTPTPNQLDAWAWVESNQYQERCRLNMYTHMFMYIYICMYIDMFIYEYMFYQIHICMYAYTYMYIHIYTYIYIHTYVCIH